MTKQNKSVSSRKLLQIETLEDRVLLAADIVHRVNAGGPELSATPAWTIDDSFLVEGGGSPGFSNPIDITGLTLPEGTSPGNFEALFQTERFDFNTNVEYEFPVDPGNYEVRLYFAETFGGAATVGGRVFDILIEDQVVAPAFDIFVAAGNQGNRGVVETFFVNSDSSLDIDFSRITENPSVSGIEIISLDDMRNVLGTTSVDIDFGQEVVSSSATEQVVLTNLGGAGDPVITIDPANASVTGSEFTFTFEQAGLISLAPGESTTVDITYLPTDVGADSATLAIPNSGVESPLSIALSGEGVSTATVGFSISQLQGTQGLFSGTTLAFGPDGRLYVGQGFGNIQALEIEQVGPNDFQVVSQETITVINEITNHEDDGTPNSVNTRIIGGIVVAGTADNPILYVASSDPRTNENDSIDTNSGIISRVTRNAQGEYERLDLVRGIPRSGRDHINGGLQLLNDENGNPTTLLHAVGSFTNRGAPSAPFGDVPEFALAAAILSVDLEAIGDTTFDLPTLDDPDRPNIVQIERDANGVPIPDANGNAIPILDVNGNTIDELDEFGTAIDRAIAPDGSLVPLIEDAVVQGQGIGDIFGGNGGLNQARLTPNSPVQIFASGLRNAFDLVVTEEGLVYATDNGPNAGFGNNIDIINGVPDSFSQDGPAGPTAQDQLHFISEPGRDFFGHTNPTRASSQNLFGGQSPVAGTLNGVPFDLSDPGEVPFVEPASPADEAITTFNGSTNGITEFTAGNFGGALQGALLTITLNGTVTSILHNPDTGEVETNVLATIQDSGRELDITVAPDNSPLAGTIFVANVDTGAITVLEPVDGAGTGGTPDDLDGDGFSNEDEEANGTDPNNPASLPSDNDGDFISDLTDDDDDNDTIVDVDDAFALDAANGQDTVVGTFFSFDNFVEAQGGILGLGFTGAQTNGTLDFLDAVDPAAVTAIGAAGVFTVDSALAGTARGASNDQLQALQFGVNVAQETEPFTALTNLFKPFADITSVQAGQEQGLYIGTGDQDNFISIILTGDDGGSIQAIREVNGVTTVEASAPFVFSNAEDTELFLTVDPLTSTVQAAYRSANETDVTTLGGPIAIPAEWLTDAALAVGVTSSNPFNSDQLPGGAEDFSVTYDFLGVVRDIDDRGAEAIVTVDAGGNITNSSTFNAGSFVIENTSSNGQSIESVTIDLSTAFLPDLVFDANGGAGDPVGRGFEVDSGLAETGAVGVFTSPRDGGFEVLEISFNGFDVGESLSFGTDIDPTSIQGVAGIVPGNPGEISGLELAGATIIVSYEDGTTTTSQLAPVAGSEVASAVNTRSGAPEAPGLELVGIGVQPNVVAPNDQTLRISGPVGGTVLLQQIEAALLTETVPDGGFDIDLFEANTVLSVDEQSFVIGASGFVDVPVTLLRTQPTGGLNHFLATVVDPIGRRSDVSRVLVESRPADLLGEPAEVFNINFLADGGANQNATLNGTAFTPGLTPVAFVGTTFNETPGNSQDVGATNASLQNLTSSEGAASAVDVTIEVNSGTFDFGSDDTSNTLLQNYFTINDGFSGADPAAATITFSDLGAGSAWDIYIVSQGDTNGQGGVFTIGGEVRTSTGSIPASSDFVEGENFVVFTDVQADANGEIAAVFDNFAATGFGVLNGIQLVRREVPGSFTPGDFDGNGEVELADNDVFAKSFGSVTNLAADGNNDNIINAADFVIFRDHSLATSSPVTSPVVVEEPTSAPVTAASDTVSLETQQLLFVAAASGPGATVVDATLVAPESVVISATPAIDLVLEQEQAEADTADEAFELSFVADAEGDDETDAAFAEEGLSPLEQDPLFSGKE